MCEAGKFTSARGAATCSPCPAGTKSNPGHTSDTCDFCINIAAYTDCTTCAAGYYKNTATSCMVMSPAHSRVLADGVANLSVALAT